MGGGFLARARTPEERRAKLDRAIAEGRSKGDPAPPVQPGQMLALQHGGFSAAIVNPRAQDKLEAWLVDPAFPEYAKQLMCRGALRDLARVETRIDLYDEMCERLEAEDAITEVVDTAEDVQSYGEASSERTARTKRRLPPDEVLRRWMAHANNLRSQLGLTPLSAARLGKDVSSAKVDLAKIWAEEERREAESREVSGSQ